MTSNLSQGLNVWGAKGREGRSDSGTPRGPPNRLVVGTAVSLGAGVGPFLGISRELSCCDVNSARHSVANISLPSF